MSREYIDEAKLILKDIDDYGHVVIALTLISIAESLDNINQSLIGIDKLLNESQDYSGAIRVTGLE